VANLDRNRAEVRDTGFTARLVLLHVSLFNTGFTERHGGPRRIIDVA
jgi:hypothetical protein